MQPQPKLRHKNTTCYADQSTTEHERKKEHTEHTIWEAKDFALPGVQHIAAAKHAVKIAYELSMSIFEDNLIFNRFEK